MRFFTGLHQPSDAKHFDAAFISVNRLRNRKGPFQVGDWIMDSAGFTEVSTHGGYRFPVTEYAEQIKRWAGNGHLLAAVTQDYMCEPFIIQKTGLTVLRHQELTIERYDALLACDRGGGVPHAGSARLHAGGVPAPYNDVRRSTDLRAVGRSGLCV